MGKTRSQHICPVFHGHGQRSQLTETGAEFASHWISHPVNTQQLLFPKHKGTTPVEIRQLVTSQLLQLQPQNMQPATHMHRMLGKPPHKQMSKKAGCRTSKVIILITGLIMLHIQTAEIEKLNIVQNLTIDLKSLHSLIADLKACSSSPLPVQSELQELKQWV